MSKLFSVLSIVVASLTLVKPVWTHEFWIEPLDFSLEQSESIAAHNRIGQMLKGDVDPFIASTFVRFTVTDPEETRTVEGRLGDRPALKMMPKRGGLHIAAYQSTVSTLTYREPEKFVNFITKEGFPEVQERHAARGLPEKDFREAYTRFGKSLIAVGDAAGFDRALGLRIEVIALTNPYVESSPVDVQVLYENSPLADVQIAIFRRDSAGDVTRETLRTDTKGRATIPRKDAAMTLLSAVHMVEPETALAERRDVVWHSLWGSLTYGQLNE